jgi:hypothetical protein
MSERRCRERGAPCAAAMLLGAAIAASAGAGAADGASATGASVEDIRDIRGPKADRPEWIMPAVIAGAGLVALAGYGIWRRRRGRRAPNPSPLELAERRLEEIRSLMTPADSVRFAVEISAVVREYIEHRFEVGATQLTTEEFLRKMLESSDAALARQRALLSEFLRQCDIVKFADVRLTVDAMDSLHRSALLFVREAAHRKEAHDSLPST